MINCKEHVHVHNRFDLQLIDSTTGEVKQTAQAENVVLNSFWSIAYSTLRNILAAIELGTGTGTPSSSDTALFNRAFRSNYAGGVTPYTRIKREIAYPTSTLTGSYTFPATSAFVGNLTEIGILGGNIGSSGSRTLITHAMLVDSEGNPISINKTDLDILIVTVTVYLTLSSPDGDFTLDTVNNNFWKCFYDELTSGTEPIAGALRLYTCATDNFVGGALSPGQSFNWDTATRTIRATGTRLGTASGNTNYINGIGLAGHGWFKLPNSNVFPSYEIKGIDVGTGDGSTTTFDCPIPVFVKDTDVLYKNSVALTRGVDYTIDNKQNKAKLSCISAFNFAEMTEPLAAPADWTTETIPSGSVGIAFTTAEMLETQKRYWLKDSHVIHLANPDSLIGNSINAIVFDNFNIDFSIADRYGNFYAYGTVKYIFEYSVDGTTWLPLVSPTITIPSGSKSSAVYSGIVTFDTVQANYIRVSVDESATSLSTWRSGAISVSAPWPYLGSNLGSIKAMYVGQPITFTNAPAEGDVITLDVTVDRPFKNSNFVIDSSMSITFS